VATLRKFLAQNGSPLVNLTCDLGILSDKDLLDGLSMGEVTEFRDSVGEFRILESIYCFIPQLDLFFGQSSIKPGPIPSTYME
jgi:hypothetical protein